jgi:hypothetical protein
MLTIRVLVVAALFGAALYGNDSDDITIPMNGGGSIVIRDPHFISTNQFNINEPELTFVLVNNAKEPWTSLSLHFDIGGFCKGEVRQWSFSLAVSPSTDWTNKWFKQNVESLRLKLQGCRAELIKARIGEGVDGVVLSTNEIEEHRTKREAEEAEEKQIAAEERERKAELQAKHDAAEAAHKKRLEEEQRKKDAEESRRLRATCTLLYKTTVDKKVSDLTVGEEQRVRACQSLGLYPPR